MVARLRGAKLYVNRHGTYKVRTADKHIAAQAVRDVAEALGLTLGQYLLRLEREGAALLNRFPTPHEHKEEQ